MKNEKNETNNAAATLDIEIDLEAISKAPKAHKGKAPLSDVEIQKRKNFAQAVKDTAASKGVSVATVLAHAKYKGKTMKLHNFYNMVPKNRKAA